MLLKLVSLGLGDQQCLCWVHLQTCSLSLLLDIPELEQHFFYNLFCCSYSYSPSLSSSPSLLHPFYFGEGSIAL